MLHGSWVRASFACYSKFTLLINSSPGFGSSPCHLSMQSIDTLTYADSTQTYAEKNSAFVRVQSATVRASVLRTERRPFRLAFTLTPQQSCLVNDIELTRWIVLQKARSHPAEAGLLLFVSIWFQILFHLPHRDTFHLSLTVLISLSITKNI